MGSKNAIGLDISKAKHLSEINYDGLLEMCHFGARVLHKKSVRYAKQNNVEININNAHEPGAGTTVKEIYLKNDPCQFLGANGHRYVYFIEHESDSAEISVKKLDAALKSNDLPHLEILSTEVLNSLCMIAVTSNKELLETCIETLRSIPEFEISKDLLGKSIKPIINNKKKNIQRDFVVTETKFEGKKAYGTTGREVMGKKLKNVL